VKARKRPHKNDRQIIGCGEIARKWTIWKIRHPTFIESFDLSLVPKTEQSRRPLKWGPKNKIDLMGHKNASDILGIATKTIVRYDQINRVFAKDLS
jgi:hypothetical protein